MKIDTREQNFTPAYYRDKYICEKLALKFFPGLGLKAMITIFGTVPKNGVFLSNQCYDSFHNIHSNF
jgi:hypothetical protein